MGMLLLALFPAIPLLGGKVNANQCLYNVFA